MREFGVLVVLLFVSTVIAAPHGDTEEEITHGQGLKESETQTEEGQEIESQREEGQKENESQTEEGQKESESQTEEVQKGNADSDGDSECQPSHLEQLCYELSQNDVLEAMMGVGRVLSIIESKSSLKDASDTKERANDRSLNTEEEDKNNDRVLAGVKGRGPRPRPNLRGNKYTNRKKNSHGQQSQSELCFGLKFLYAAKAMDNFGEVDAEVFLELLADVQNLEDDIIDGISSVTYNCVDSNYEVTKDSNSDNGLGGKATAKCESADKFVHCLYDGMKKQFCPNIKINSKRKERQGRHERNHGMKEKCHAN